MKEERLIYYRLCNAAYACKRVQAILLPPTQRKEVCQAVWLVDDSAAFFQDNFLETAFGPNSACPASLSMPAGDAPQRFLITWEDDLQAELSVLPLADREGYLRDHPGTRLLVNRVETPSLSPPANQQYPPQKKHNAVQIALSVYGILQLLAFAAQQPALLLFVVSLLALYIASKLPPWGSSLMLLVSIGGVVCCHVLLFSWRGTLPTLLIWAVIWLWCRYGRVLFSISSTPEQAMGRGWGYRNVRPYCLLEYDGSAAGYLRDQNGRSVVLCAKCLPDGKWRSTPHGYLYSVTLPEGYRVLVRQLRKGSALIVLLCDNALPPPEVSDSLGTSFAHNLDGAASSPWMFFAHVEEDSQPYRLYIGQETLDFNLCVPSSKRFYPIQIRWGK